MQNINFKQSVKIKKLLLLGKSYLDIARTKLELYKELGLYREDVLSEYERAINVLTEAVTLEKDDSVEIKSMNYSRL